MKIVFVNTFELTGGAAIAANRLAQSLRKCDVDVKFLVREKQSDDSQTLAFNTSFISKIVSSFLFYYERLCIFWHNKLSKKNLFAVSLANTGNDISKNKIIKEADIIHIHWINQGFLSIGDLKKLTTLGKPIVWTMHDQWSYTGICHYTGGCKKFTDTCSCCPQLENPKKNDLSYKIFQKKKKLYQSNAFTFVGCSKWISDEARKSKLCHQANIISIPNSIDITTYSKQNKTEARKLLNLPLHKKLILFGACKVTDKRKGFDYMKASCDILYNQKKDYAEDIVIVIFGGKTEEIEQFLPFRIHNTGYIRNMETMVRLYNAVDLFVIPSIEDNLPNTVMEAMACGTPCVGFNTGGIPEMIEHKKNGYVAGYKNAKELAEGISWVLDEADYDEISACAREKVVTNYSEDTISKQYKELYQDLLS